MESGRRSGCPTPLTGNAIMSHEKRTKTISPCGRKRYFATNLRFAIILYGWSLKDASKNLGVPYPWLRRAVTAGVYWNRKSNPAVEQIATYFGCSPELLWDPDCE